MRLLCLRLVAMLCALPLALGVSACAKTVSTSGLKGEAKGAAETIKNLQSDVTAGDQKKVCDNDLAHAVVAGLSSFRGGCEAAVKEQLAEIDSVELTVESVRLGGTTAARTATARVKSVYSGKKKVTTMSLVKERGKWKVSSFTSP